MIKQFGFDDKGQLWVLLQNGRLLQRQTRVPMNEIKANPLRVEGIWVETRPPIID